MKFKDYINEFCDNDKCNKNTPHIEDKFGFTCTKCGHTEKFGKK
jgi:hypothetical protein